MRVLNDEEEARNVLQETFLQAYQRLDTFRRESKVTTWLYAIGINLARAARRKLARYDNAFRGRPRPAATKIYRGNAAG